jgi:protein-serine/threonine kinase
MYQPNQFMDTRPAPRPPIDRPPKLYLTPDPTLHGNPNLRKLTSASTPTLASPTTTVGKGSGFDSITSEFTVIKDGWAKVKEEGGSLLKFWNERFLILREKQLEFLKSNTSSKISQTILLRGVKRHAL